MTHNVSIVFLEEVEAQYLRESIRRQQSQEPISVSLAVVETAPRGHKNGAALLVRGEEIIGGAHIVKGKRADDIRRRIDLTNIVLLKQRLPTLDNLRSRLLESQHPPTRGYGGAFTANAAERAQQWALDEFPELSTCFLSLSSSEKVSSNRLAVLAEQQDATTALFAIAQFDVESVLDPSERTSNDDRQTFIPSDKVIPNEDALIEHDVTLFLEWKQEPTNVVGIRQFSDRKGRTLQVMNANRTRAESAAGTDLIYYHKQRKSFVLIQYKRLKNEAGNWIYRPDKQLRKQLVAMSRIDKQCRDIDSNEFRLFQSPSFVKICKLETLDLESNTLVPGMYMAREQVEMHLTTGDRGPGNGIFFSFENAPNYLTNTLFTDLVAQGLIGSRGTDTDFIRKQITASLSSTGSTVVGILSDETARRPGRKQPAERIR